MTVSWRVESLVMDLLVGRLGSKLGVCPINIGDVDNFWDLGKIRKLCRPDQEKISWGKPRFFTWLITYSFQKQQFPQPFVCGFPLSDLIVLLLFLLSFKRRRGRTAGCALTLFAAACIYPVTGLHFCRERRPPFFEFCQSGNLLSLFSFWDIVYVWLDKGGV